MSKSTMANGSVNKADTVKEPAVTEVLLSPPEAPPGAARLQGQRSLRQKVAFILPFVWPDGNRPLQGRVVIAFLLLVAIRVVSVLVPIYSKNIAIRVVSVLERIYLKNIVNVLTATQEPTLVLPTGGDSASTVPLTPAAPNPGAAFPWVDITIFIFLRSLRGGAGFLNCLRSLVFVRVTQHAQKALRLRLFSHLHALSLRWHLHRKTGEVIKVMDRGVTSVSQILSHVQANLVPVIIDIVIAIIYFTVASDVWIGLIVLVTMASYLIITVAMSEWRKKFRRNMNEADNARNATGVDSILNFETVKYFSAEAWETAMYEESIDKFQEREFLVNVTANALGTVQNLIMSLGLLGGCLLSAWYVHKGHFRVGDYVLFLTYIHQLYEPLDLFGAYYRILQQAVVDMENMFDMLAEQQEVQDCAGAPELCLYSGQIEFNNVSFSYSPSKPLLTNLSFIVPPGQTYALVGLSGSGKTTVTRLLMRFYDIQTGCILIDQQDIAKVTQRSLRQHIGVVPQDTGLFNREVRYNIRYGRVTATDQEVEEAARTADIHDRIVSMADGYDSRIGERGLKLSGGERQRIAIARTVLKAPEIVLLDEATSALDTQTERHIQTSLGRVCESRTTLVVAHRLSTVIHAHQILVLDAGTVRERGRHEELLSAGGIYAQMWVHQQRSPSASSRPTTVPLSAPSTASTPLQAPPSTATARSTPTSQSTPFAPPTDCCASQTGAPTTSTSTCTASTFTSPANSESTSARAAKRELQEPP